MKLSTAGIAAFLMLIGYSVDTDILLSSHLLKRKEGGMWVRLHSAFKTGIMMSVTTTPMKIKASMIAMKISLKKLFPKEDPICSTLYSSAVSPLNAP